MVATVAELKKEGFEASEFSTDAANFDSFLQDVLDEQALIVGARIGLVVYTSTDAAVLNRIKRAERFLAAAELWLRRMNNVESDVSLGGDAAGGKAFERYAFNHKSYANKAEQELAALPSASVQASSPSTGAAFGVVTTTHFNPARNKSLAGSNHL